MEMGALIKYYRTQRGITQSELAKGICSVPHLSKIENNFKEANDETLALLLERLEISMGEMQEKEGQIKLLLREFSSAIHFYQKKEIEEIFQRIKEVEPFIPFSRYIYIWELYKFRFLLFKGQIDEATRQRDLLYKLKKNFSQHEDYLFRYYHAILLILEGQYRNADELLEALYIENEQEATSGEFLYHRALVKSSLDQPGHAIHFGKMALQLFMNQHNFTRILHTLMLLGINYTHSHIYEEALGCFQHLIRNAEILREERLLPQIYHNMGYLQSKMGDFKAALTFYKKSLALQDTHNYDYLVTLYTIGELHFYLHSLDKAHECFQDVHTMARDLGVKKFRLLADYYLLRIASPEKSYKFLEAKVIPFFEEVDEHSEYMTKFYKLLADYYNQQNMAQKAVKYLYKLT
ncbi:tetratricopeptide repeat protein [Neobacillus sp. LXY-1]|uniref:helix-turn-helix domain-containing protein n=1 Tax=Neobacillus sp. LXY-1 TaxID=3379133 RepID=UPI003EE1C80D